MMKKKYFSKVRKCWMQEWRTIKAKPIKNQGEKQFDKIQKQNKNQLKPIKKENESKDIVYLIGGIDKLFELYPKFFQERNMIVLKRLAKKEYKTDCKKNCYTKSLLLKKINLNLMRSHFKSHFRRIWCALWLVRKSTNQRNKHK